MPRPEDLPLETLRLIDGPCVVFERELLAGNTPRIEEAVTGVPESVRPQLLAELLHMEWDHHGAESPEAWAARFPDREALVRAEWASREPGREEVPAFGPGLQCEGRIDSGGMGVIWRVRDAEFGRELAAKMAARHDATADWVRAEARTTAALQHPNIPPVHGTGTLTDGRPFFTMKLVRGETLAELLRARSDPAEDLPKFLSILRSVCQAVGYAHSRAVVHRDLKPRNVMVGEFGEVQVMDWGLAVGPADCVGRPAGVVGTFAYMPPEQASGRAEPPDPRCDVFCLGGVLCEILTGEPPYRGTDTTPTRRAARTADLGPAFARLEAAAVSPALKDLARECLAADPGDRPTDADVIARRLGEYQRAVIEAAEETRLAEERRRVKDSERHKRRRWQYGLVATVVALVFGGSMVGMTLAHRASLARTEANSAHKEAARELVEAESALRSGDDDRAGSSLRAAEIRLEAYPEPSLSERAGRLRDELSLSRELAGVRGRRIIFRDWDANGKPLMTAYRAAFARHGLDPETLPRHRFAERVAAAACRERVVTALDDWALLSDEQQDPRMRDRLLALGAALGDGGPVAELIRDPASWGDPEGCRELAANISPDTLPSLLLLLAGMVPREDGIALLSRAVERNPSDLWLHAGLGIALYERRDPQALVALKTALALDPSSARLNYALGLGYEAAKDRDASARQFRRAMRLDPNYCWPYLALAAHQLQDHHYEEAFRLVREAGRIEPHRSAPKAFLAWVHLQSGDLPSAADAYRVLIREHPDHRDGHERLLALLQRQGKADEAAEIRSLIAARFGGNP